MEVYYNKGIENLFKRGMIYKIWGIDIRMPKEKDDEKNFNSGRSARYSTIT